MLTLIVGDDLHSAVHEDAHAREGGAEVNADGGALLLLVVGHAVE